MDPLSLTASIIAVATLAEGVVTKLYKYVKAVKDCEDEVQKLKVQADVLSGVLERLARLAEEEEENEEDTEGENGERRQTTTALPGFIPACQSTLKEIELVLISFERKGARVPADRSRRSNPKQSLFSRLSKSDLKWPFSKPKTLEIIDNLERHKSTCILALGAQELSGIREVLETTKITSKVIADIKSNTEKLLEFQHSKKTMNILNWFAPNNPATKHSEFRRDYQEGTGYWILETPEYIEWLKTRNSALWIHGIPGAGKTILASLVIETLSSSIIKGFAYFYCRYNDPGSQNPESVVGSLIAQLCLQNEKALEDALLFYGNHNDSSRLPTRPNETELGKFLQKISKHFDQVHIVIDGLDEVGAAIVVDRSDLIALLSTLHHEPSHMKTIIFSRAESDIQSQLTEFKSVSIAARSSDLQLYVAAKLRTLAINDNHLRLEVLEALVRGADGMFFWTVCQIQLLAGLPNAASIRQALKSLPPGLPATYSRIFERLNSQYPQSTQILIQRTLLWLVAPQDRLPIDSIAQAISIEDDTVSLDRDRIPDLETIARWLGCLVRTQHSGYIELAHFSIREFLCSPEETVSSEIARQYLVTRARRETLAATCVSYLALTDFNETKVDLFDRQARDAFHARYPFYTHAATWEHHMQAFPADETMPQFQRFFASPTPRSLTFWNLFAGPNEDQFNPGLMKSRDLELDDARNGVSSLHVASGLRLVNTVKCLLSAGANPNSRLTTGRSPLHFLMASLNGLVVHRQRFWFLDDTPLRWNLKLPPTVHGTLKYLIKGRANLNQLARYEIAIYDPSNHIYVSPLYVALWYRQRAICCRLVKNGAKIMCELSQLHRLMESFTSGKSKDSSGFWEAPWDVLFERILEARDDKYIRAAIEFYRPKAPDKKLGEDSSEQQLPESTKADDENAFVRAVSQDDYKGVAWYLEKGVSPDAEDDWDGSALSTAIRRGNWEMGQILLDAGASLHLNLSTGSTPLIDAFRWLSFFQISNWLGPLDKLEILDHEYEQIFSFARRSEQDMAVLKYLLDRAKREKKLHILQSTVADLETIQELQLPTVNMLEVLMPYGLLMEKELGHLFILNCTSTRMHLIHEIIIQDTEFDPISCTNKVLGNTNDRKWEKCQRAGTYPSCLSWATSCARPEILLLLLDRVSKFYTKERTPSHLSEAIDRGNSAIVNIWLEWGSDPCGISSSGVPIIHHAARDLPYSDEAFEHEHKNSECPLECEANKGKARVMKLLEKAGADLKTTYRGTNTIRHVIRNRSMEVMKYLISRDPDFNTADAWGDRPLHIACDYGFDAGVDFLLEQASVLETINDASDTLGTPLYIASYEGHASIVENILQAGAGVDLMPPGNAFGPALYAACANNHRDIVYMLLHHGANLEVTGPRYKSALEVAAAFGQIVITHALENWTRWALTGEPAIKGMDVKGSSVQGSAIQKPTSEESISDGGSFIEITSKPLPFFSTTIAERWARRPLRLDEVEIGHEGSPFQRLDATRDAASGLPFRPHSSRSSSVSYDWENSRENPFSFKLRN